MGRALSHRRSTHYATQSPRGTHSLNAVSFRARGFITRGKMKKYFAHDSTPRAVMAHSLAHSVQGRSSNKQTVTCRKESCRRTAKHARHKVAKSTKYQKKERWEEKSSSSSLDEGKKERKKRDFASSESEIEFECEEIWNNWSLTIRRPPNMDRRHSEGNNTKITNTTKINFHWKVSSEKKKLCKLFLLVQANVSKENFQRHVTIFTAYRCCLGWRRHRVTST